MDKTIIKVPVSVEEAQALTTSANAKGISRGEYCREILIGHLAGTGTGPQVPNEGLSRALEESQKDRDGLQKQVHELEKTLAAKQDDLTWTRGQLVETQRNLSAALEKIPRITDGKEKPGWWSRLFGK